MGDQQQQANWIQVVESTKDGGHQLESKVEELVRLKEEEAKAEKEDREDFERRRSLQARLWILLALTFMFGLSQLLLSHVSHSLALRSDAYHTIYNLLTLISGLATFRLGERGVGLRNTFGWARVEVLGAAVTMVFLAALNFSVVVEALQTLTHASHGNSEEEVVDAMHMEGAVLGLGATGLALNLISFILLKGGYTAMQMGFLARVGSSSPQKCRILCWILRDTAGCFLVVASALVTMFFPGAPAIYFDPIAALVAVIIITASSVQYIGEASAILLQTLPASLDLKTFQEQLRSRFPSLVDVHEIHVWQLNPSQIVATAHLVFPSAEVYLSARKGLDDFFAEWGVSHATLQPEFLQTEFEQTKSNKSYGCYLRCELDSCKQRRCCSSTLMEDSLKDVSEEFAQRESLLRSA